LKNPVLKTLTGKVTTGD